MHQGDAPDRVERNRPACQRRRPYNRHSDPSTPHHHQKTEGVADAAADADHVVDATGHYVVDADADHVDYAAADHVVDADAHLPDEDGKVGETMDG